MINRIISSERSKWILVIGLVSIGAGFTAKNVISYPTECISEDFVQDFVKSRGTMGNFTIFYFFSSISPKSLYI